MRIEREMQVFSELGYRGTAPVLKHMKVGLALILPTHRERAQVSAPRTNTSHLLIHRRRSMAKM